MIEHNERLARENEELQKQLNAARIHNDYLLRVLNESNNYLSETQVKDGKNVRLNHIGADSILHKKMSQVVDEINWHEKKMAEARREKLLFKFEKQYRQDGHSRNTLLAEILNYLFRNDDPYIVIELLMERHESLEKIIIELRGKEPQPRYVGRG